MKPHAVVVGGAGPNVGSAITRRLLSDGWGVTVLDKDRLAGDRLVEELKPDVRFRYADVMNTAEFETEVSNAFDTSPSGKPGALVVSVGGAPAPDLATETTPEDFEDTLRLNLTSAFLATKAAIPKLAERGGGSVIFLSSTNSLLGGLSQTAYAVSKAGVNALVSSLTADYGMKGIRFNAIAAGSIVGDESETWNRREEIDPGTLEHVLSLYPLGRFGRPEDIASAAAFLCSQDASWISGVVLPVDGGLAAVGGLPGGRWWVPRRPIAPPERR